MDKPRIYAANVVLLLTHPMDERKTEKWQKLFKFSEFFHAVPGNRFPVCQTMDRWFEAKIEHATGAPAHFSKYFEHDNLHIQEVTAKIVGIVTLAQFESVSKTLKYFKCEKVK